MPRTRLTLLLLALAVIARAPHLVEGLWYDEIAAWAEVGARGARVIVTEWPDPVNHVFAVLLAWLSIEAFDGALGTEVAMRLPAFLASLATVPVMMGLARRIAPGRLEVLAGGAAALAPVIVLEGTEARGYAFMMLAAALGTLCAADGCAGRRRMWIAYPVVLALGTWAHPVTAAVAAGHAVVLTVLAVRRSARAALPGLAAVAGAGLLTLACYAPILDDIIAWRSRAVATNPDQPGLFGTEGYHALLELGGAWWWWSALPGLAGVAIGAAALRRRAHARIPVALALAGLPVALAAVLVGDTWVYARFLLFAVPGALLLAAVGIDALGARRGAIGIAAAVVVASVWIADLALRPPRQPLREAAAYVRTHRAAGERTLVIGLRHGVFDLYGADLTPTHALRHGADLGRHLREDDPQWVVMLYAAHVLPGAQASLADAGFVEAARLRGWIDWGGGTVVILHRDGGTP